MNSLSVIAISVLLLAPAAEPTEMPRSPKPFTPTAAYQTWTIHGFTFRMSPEIREHPEAAIELVGELDTQLCQIIVALPPQALANLREVTTWVEYDSLPGRSACYHVSRDWLIPNGYNPEKAGAVEISTVRNFIDWSRKAQPWQLFHELAHSYHMRVLGEDHPAVAAAFRQAQERKLYESVRYIRGNQQRAYALSNSKEYFAELSEAYFGQNDFFPFNRQELERHDPVGYQMMIDAWGDAEPPSAVRLAAYEEVVPQAAAPLALSPCRPPNVLPAAIFCRDNFSRHWATGIWGR